MADSALKVFAEGTSVHFVVSLDELGPFAFTFPTSSAWSAKLLAREIGRVLGANQSTIREEAYRHGWKDAKAKRAKSTWFSERLP